MRLLLILLLLPLVYAPAFAQNSKQDITLAIHGGAGTITRENMTPEREQQYRQALEEALKAGHAVLVANGTSEEAVIAAIMTMENSPLFNAGKGAVYTNAGKNEMDAAIMLGHNLNAGAVTGITRTKNPILLAQSVMNKSQHVMLSGEGADVFAEENELEMVDPSYFGTESRLKSLERAKARELGTGKYEYWLEDNDFKYGTVGAVALDVHGNLAAATSTGGMTNKRWGRIGDAPIIGAGTYANNASVAVSATGHGEYFIRSMVAHDIAALVQYRNMSVLKAAKMVIFKKMAALGGTGGVIVLDRDGNYTMPFNTEGMYRGAIRADGTMEIGIYGEE
jgi:beta-aspartyl-peptidase (threonine type)